MRDRLIELILECSTFTPEYAKQARLHAEYVAQHLLNEGVIVPPCKVGDKVAVRALCECIYTHANYEECRNECPFEDDCVFAECDDSNEGIFATKIDSIYNNGFGWKLTFKHFAIEADIRDLGKSFFVGDDAEEQAKRYAEALGRSEQ